MKKTTLLSLVATAAFTCVHADMHDDNNYQSKHEDGHVKVTEKTGKPDAWDGYVYAAFTYWNGRANDMSFATVQASSTYKQQLMSNPETMPGFLVGAGMFFEPSNVDINAQYTWFYNEKNKGQSKIKTTTLTGTDIYEGGWQTAGGTWAVQFNRIDFLFSKLLNFNKYFEVIPGGGIVANWADNYYDVKFADNILNTLITGSKITQNSEGNWGVGPYVRMMGNFLLPFGDMDWSSIVLFFHSGVGFNWQESKPRYLETSSSSEFDGLNSGFNYNYMNAMLDGSLGLRWKMNYDDDSAFKFALELSWQTQTWFNYIHSQGTDTGLDLNLQGLTVGAGVMF